MSFVYSGTSVSKPRLTWRQRDAARIAANDRKEVERAERAAVRELFTPEDVKRWGTFEHPLPMIPPSSRPDQKHWRWDDLRGDLIVIPR